MKQTLECDSIKQQLLRVHEAIAGLSREAVMEGPAARLDPPFRLLDRLAAADVTAETVWAVWDDPSMSPVLETIACFREAYGLRLEIERAESLLDSRNPGGMLESFLFYPNYLKLAEMECRGAGLRKGDTVVFLGSGPLPLSLMVLFREYAVQGIGIERVDRYAELSRKVIEHLGLGEGIGILRGDHFLFPLKEAYDLVMVASAARPKQEIFTHLGKVVPDGTRLSYRIYEKGLRSLLGEKPSFHLPPELHQTLRLRPEPPVNNTVVFLVKTVWHGKQKS
jgi:hypothetical protein